MYVMAVINIILLMCCIFEVVLLLKDRGIIAEYVCKTKAMIISEGWKRTIGRIFNVIFGKVAKFQVRPSGDKLKKGELLQIAFYPTGGMGDYIISSKLLDELMMYAPCCVTVFCEKDIFGQAIYGERPDVIVKPYERFEIEKNQYDLALMVEHFIHVLHADERRIEHIAPELFLRINYIREHWNELYIRIPEQCWRERIHFERCRVLKLNRWTELRMGGAFEIKDQRTGISLDFEEKKNFNILDLPIGQYITINRGADQMKPGQEQLKVWPEEYYIKLVEKIKAQFPQIKVVQLGGSDSKKVKGVDRTFLGESFELTKWIIKKAQCHIDCEGGLVHLATQMSTPCVVIFGPTPIHMYSYVQNINLVSHECNNCMGTHEDWAYNCYRELEQWCMYKVKPDDVILAYTKIANNCIGNTKRLVQRTTRAIQNYGKLALVNVSNVEHFYPYAVEHDVVVFSTAMNNPKCKIQCFDNHIEYRYSIAENLACDNDSFDTVLIEKFDDKEETLEEALRITRIGGTVLILEKERQIEYQCVG